MRPQYEPTIALQVFLAGAAGAIASLVVVLVTAKTIDVVLRKATHEVASNVVKLISPNDQQSVQQAA